MSDNVGVVRPWRTPADLQNRRRALDLAERRARAAVLAARARAAMPEPPADPARLTALIASFTPPEGYGTREDDRWRPGSPGATQSPTGEPNGPQWPDPRAGFMIPTDSEHPWARKWRAEHPERTKR